MRVLRAQLEAVASTDSAILLIGETGTGKGAIARLLHARSRRSAAPFVHFDCAGIAPSLIESALFGHERGAFTGAHARCTGRVEAAGDGTLFLDEIAELERPAQARLLRLLEDGVFERIGGTRTLRMGARVVSATHRDLGAAVADGGFREDLLHRLAVVVLRVPPVRERREDLPELLARAADRARRRTGAPAPPVAAGAMRVLLAHRWPGNVREIMNVMERAAACWPGRTVDAALARRLVDIGALVRPEPATARSPQAGGGGVAARDDTVLIATLDQCGGNVSRAARLLGLPRSTLRYRLRALSAGSCSDRPRQPCLPGLDDRP